MDEHGVEASHRTREQDMTDAEISRRLALAVIKHHEGSKK